MPVRPFCFLVFVLFSFAARAQLDNSAFYRPLPVGEGRAHEVRLNLDVLGFSKNNEYFNKIADGYTLFGYHFNPRLSYYPTDSVRVDGGIFLRKDFGTPGLFTVEPTLTVKVQRPHGQFLFGTLQGTASHRYIEPLYDFERVILNRIENGIQYIGTYDKFWFDAWIDWQRSIYRRSPYQEEIAGGISSETRLFQSSDSLWRLSLPLQFTGQHIGGQIDTDPKPLTTVFNGAAGLKLEKRFRSKVFQRAFTENHLVGFLDYSFENQLPFERGRGIYLNAGLDTKYQTLLISYWRGSDYVALLGGRLYQSASTTVHNPDYVEPDRELLIIRFLHDIRIYRDLTVTLRFEPHFDLNTGYFEFSNSLYVNFTSDLFLTRTRPEFK